MHSYCNQISPKGYRWNTNNVIQFQFYLLSVWKLHALLKWWTEATRLLKCVTELLLAWSVLFTTSPSRKWNLRSPNQKLPHLSIPTFASRLVGILDTYLRLHRRTSAICTKPLLAHDVSSETRPKVLYYKTMVTPILPRRCVQSLVSFWALNSRYAFPNKKVVLNQFALLSIERALCMSSPTQPIITIHNLVRLTNALLCVQFHQVAYEICLQLYWGKNWAQQNFMLRHLKNELHI